MSRNFAFGIITTLVISLSSFAATNPAVFGNWTAHQEQSGFQFDMLVSISETQTSLGVKCSYQGQSVQASATVPSEVTETQLLLKGEAHETKHLGNLDCSVYVVPMAFEYSLNGDVLNLTAEGRTVPFQKVK